MLSEARPYSRALGGADLGAKQFAGDLHPVADAQHGHAQFEQPLVAARSAFFVNAGRAARKDDAGGLDGGEFFDADVRGDEHAENAGLAHATRDQLNVLAAEVEDRHDLALKAGRDLKFGGHGGGVRARLGPGSQGL